MQLFQNTNHKTEQQQQQKHEITENLTLKSETIEKTEQTL